MKKKGNFPLPTIATFYYFITSLVYYFSRSNFSVKIEKWSVIVRKENFLSASKASFYWSVSSFALYFVRSNFCVVLNIIEKSRNGQWKWWKEKEPLYLLPMWMSFNHIVTSYVHYYFRSKFCVIWLIERSRNRLWQKWKEKKINYSVFLLFYY